MSTDESLHFNSYTADLEDESLATRSSAPHVPYSYERRVEQVQLYHTGSTETFLPISQEQQLAALIQRGQAGHDELEQLRAHERLDAKQRARLALLQEHAAAGRHAEHVLVECHLKFAAYLARASMNILPEGDRDALPGSKEWRRNRALKNNFYYSWLPKDFTSLKSRFAVLDDRVQVANIALIKAARTFQPDVRNDKGNLVSFASYAAVAIKTRLARYIVGGDPNDHEKPVHIPGGVIDKIKKARRDDWSEHMTAEERAEFLSYDQLQDSTSWDELFFTGAVDEESDDNGDALLLWSGEAIADDEPIDPLETVAEANRSELIWEVLATMSEREQGVLRLRFGLDDGIPRTLDDIGIIYGCSRERVRQIETKLIKRLRGEGASGILMGYVAALRDLVDVTEGGMLPQRVGDVIKTGRSAGQAAVRLVTVTPTAEPPVIPGRRVSWQAYPGELWDEPVRKTDSQLEAAYAQVGERLREMIFGASLYTFQKSFAEEVGSVYPKVLVDHIQKTLGRDLRPEHIADFWNTHLEDFARHLEGNLGDDASLDRATQLMSRLLAEQMSDNDIVDLYIPETLQGKLNYVGAWLSHGEVRVHGQLDNYAGYQMNGLGQLRIEGSVQHFAGQAMSGNARLEISGDAGAFLGSGTRGSASILVRGNVGHYCGHRLQSPQALIEVLGDTGNYLGFEARSGDIIVGGKLGSVRTPRHFKGRIGPKTADN
ncbi:MAG TPA: sigma-70 family RNA polymerase sigma factor [Candidatus Saccharimonadales bacterium]|nr:sigma-70 family RNA polymerase sigma factor [Candidatus Saccharimonadales bacterium]